MGRPLMRAALLLALAVCRVASQTSSTPDLKQTILCRCADSFAPVCTDAGTLEPNACSAGCQGRSVLFECPIDQTTNEFDKQACYNKCQAAVPPQPPACACMTLFAPVCGVNGRVYGNTCEADCAQVEVRWPCQLPNSDPEDCRADCLEANGGVIDPPDDTPPPCPATLVPVCTMDGFIMESQCEAERAGYTVRWPCVPPNSTRDTCKKDCLEAAGIVEPPLCQCPMTLRYQPVCGVDGFVYDSYCAAKQCNGIKVLWPCDPQHPTIDTCKQACRKAAGVVDPPPCACTGDWEPVCASDGLVYPNTCAAVDCRGLDVLFACEDPATCKQECRDAVGIEEPPPCPCTKQYSPWCGVSGVTHPNQCMANCVDTPNFVCPVTPDGEFDIALCDSMCLEAAGGSSSDDGGTDVVGGSVGDTAWKHPLAPGSAPPCKCPAKVDKQCAKGGSVYMNTCLLKCANAQLRGGCGTRKDCAKDCKAVSKSSAKPVCKCSSKGQPFCSISGKVYPNIDCLQCNWDTPRFTCKGRPNCKTDCRAALKPSKFCNCSVFLKPVCTKKGSIATNACLAKCAEGKKAVRFSCTGRKNCKRACEKAAKRT